MFVMNCYNVYDMHSTRLVGTYFNCVCRDDSHNEYNFYLEAAISTSKQVDEDRLTYLNKGLSLSLALVSNFDEIYLSYSRYELKARVRLSIRPPL